MRNNLPFLSIMLLIFLPCISFAQNSWEELARDSATSNGSGYANFCKDGSGNTYVGVGRSVHKWNTITHTWNQLGGDVLRSTFRLFCIAADNSGNVYAAGSPYNNVQAVAKWDGTSWTELKNIATPLNLNGNINCIAVDKNNNTYIGGDFTNANGYRCIYKWNGTTWSEIKGVVTDLNANNTIYSIICDTLGNVYAAGKFLNYWGSSYRYVAKWDGNNWSELGGTGSFKAYNNINSLTVDTKNNIYAAGDFVNASGYKYVIKWNGTTWSEVGIDANALNANNSIVSISTDQNDNLYAAGTFRNNNNEYYVAKWNGATWAQLGLGTAALEPNGSIRIIQPDLSGKIFAAGYFTGTNGKLVIAKWENEKWENMISDTNSLKASGPVHCIKTDKYGNVYAAGQFKNASGYNYVAKWNGIVWHELGSTANSLNAGDKITCMVIDPVSNNIYAAGNFKNGLGKQYVAKWDGATWTELGTGANSLNANNSINSITIDTTGNVYAAGYFTNAPGSSSGSKYVAKWDGNSWTELGGPNVIQASISVNYLITDASNNIYAGISDFNNGGYNNHIAKWDGTLWSVIPQVSSNSIAVDASGNLYAAGGYFVRKWNGIAWEEVGSGTGKLNANNTVSTIAVDASGNLYAAGLFTNTKGDRYVAKWNGNVWTELDTMNALRANNDILFITTDAIGNIYAAGGFINSKGFYYVSKYGLNQQAVNNYKFIGNGNWDVPANWQNYIVPPATLNNAKEIIIDPVNASSECILNNPQYILNGSKLTVMPGKKLRILLNVEIH